MVQGGINPRKSFSQTDARHDVEKVSSQSGQPEGIVPTDAPPGFGCFQQEKDVTRDPPGVGDRRVPWEGRRGGSPSTGLTGLVGLKRAREACEEQASGGFEKTPLGQEFLSPSFSRPQSSQNFQQKSSVHGCPTPVSQCFTEFWDQKGLPQNMDSPYCIFEDRDTQGGYPLGVSGLKN